MSKAFFEVFPTLRVKQDLRTFFEETEVVRITTNADRSRYKVELTSGHLLPRQLVSRMQKELESQVFSGARSVHLLERYALSEQYTFPQLVEEYRASLNEEIAEFSPSFGRTFAEAAITASDEGMLTVTLPDNRVMRELGSEVCRRMEALFLGRFSLPVKVQMEYEAWEPRIERRDEPVQRPQPQAICPESGGDDAAFQEPLPWEDDPAEAAFSQESEPAVAPEPAATPEGEVDGMLPHDLADLPYLEVEGVGDDRVVVTKNRTIAEAAPMRKKTKAAGAKKKKAPDRPAFIRSADPRVLYGRDFEEESIPLDRVIGETDEIVVQGRVMEVSSRDIKNEKSIVFFTITDYTDSIKCKLFLATKDVELLQGFLAPGVSIRVRGKASMDAFEKDLVLGTVTGIMRCEAVEKTRRDEAPVKRVELHMHTKMSDMDGVSACKDIVTRAYEWGMPAVAITDHGNVQAFPEAYKTRKDLLAKENDKRRAAGEEPIASKDFFKVLYGVECYLVDDFKQAVSTAREEEADSRIDAGAFVVFDLETTGLSPVKNRIIEIGAVRIENGVVTERFSEFVDPQMAIPYHIQHLTHITDDMVRGAGTVEEVLPRFLEFCQGARLVGHNVTFDIGFVREKAKDLNLTADFTTLDTESISRMLLPGHKHYTLDAVSKLLGIDLEHHHRAVDDAEATAEIFLVEARRLAQRGLVTLRQVSEACASDPEVIRRRFPYHCVLLAQNETGRVNLYRLISDAHLTYFYDKKPRIPKSDLMRHREGILVGSACSRGEVFQALLEEPGKERLSEIVRFYDYLEIQPVDNHRFLLEEKNRDRYPDIRTEEDIRDINRRIVELGETFGKPVVATGDAHFLDPEDAIYRDIIKDGMPMGDEVIAPLYLRTTDKMLDEFAYLGDRKAYEVVIENPLAIAQFIDDISPVRPDKCPPVIPHSDETLRDLCYDKVHSIYGETLPPLVEERLEKELTSIINNGYSVMYIIAQKLVSKSLEDGYLVGSRGSVGSSLAATMAGITEVNPLPPHYVCPQCHYSDFDSEEVRAYRGMCGVDMPDKLCPHCHTPLKKDGFDIPFETFLGFHGDKEPDIDLNFSGEYQTKAHKYTEVIFGEGQTFKAGTVMGVAEKTAYGFVKNYLERRGIPKRRVEIERLAKGCEGVRRSTGQHPGGIVVLPLGEEITTFTPVQHPANDMNSDVITTHFDYHSIDHNLLKLDILGHDDPTMIRMLQDLTGIDPLSIPLNDPEVMSLFLGTEALHITPEQNGGIDLGILGIPEFGTKFVIGMVQDTHPKTVSELIRISGLSHGTDVWLDNAQYYIRNNYATLSTAICTRDDIMTFLISKGLENEQAFTIMERVRKGKGLTEDMKSAMRAKEVPEWYIESCGKIQYMFPRAHAAAYVMMALRIAYCKVHYPLAYYAAYFSIRASAFNYELMCMGESKLQMQIAELQHSQDLAKKDQETLEDMYIVREMYARGIRFVPIDLYSVSATRFRIVEDGIMPSLTAIQGMGGVAAQSLVEAAAQAPFLSRDDLRQRTKVSVTLIDKMAELGILGDMPETNQISLFDLMEAET